MNTLMQVKEKQEQLNTNIELALLVSEYTKIKKQIAELEHREKEIRKRILNYITNQKVLYGINGEAIAILKRITPIYNPKIVYELLDKEKFFEVIQVLNSKVQHYLSDLELNKALQDIKETTVLKLL